MIRALALVVACASCAAVPDVTYVDGGENTCPNAVPDYADICCGALPCRGTGCIAACDDCAASCKTTDLCCPNAQGHAVCRPNLRCP